MALGRTEPVCFPVPVRLRSDGSLEPTREASVALPKISIRTAARREQRLSVTIGSKGPNLQRLVVGITGASGAVYGVRLLERLAKADGTETHLVVTRPGEKTLLQETGRRIADLRPLATELHSVDRIGASIASGSFLFDAMAVVPCSMHTMSAIACGLTANLLTRAADVALKEKRRLVLAVRETPLHLGHLRTMAALAEIGAIIAPPMPAFYTLPKTVDDIVDQQVGRILDLLGVPDSGAERWPGI